MKGRNIIVLLAVLVVLGGVYFAVSRPKPAPPTPKVYVWDIKDDDIERIVISLPREGKSQAFIKISEGDKFPWYFDDGSPVDSERWGGGIPLILSGPSADRVINKNATAEELAVYGLKQPSMKITLTLVNQEVPMEIDVGDSTPDGSNYYVRAPGTNGVATVDYIWYKVIAGLVLDPPYASTGK